LAYVHTNLARKLNFFGKKKEKKTFDITRKTETLFIAIFLRVNPKKNWQRG